MASSDEIINAKLAQSIEEAILFGHIKELDTILDIVEDDEGFSEELRYGLQALRYFRAHYGKDGMLEPTEHLQKQKVLVLESAWGSELLEKLRRDYKAPAKRSA